MEELNEKLVHLLMRRNMTLATCESCTGGLLAATITEVPGVSAVFAGGFVTYTAKTKHKLAGVSRKVLHSEGTIARKTAHQMAEGTAQRCAVDCALSITGNAGPDADEDKPVGLVYIGCTVDEKTIAKKYQFEGSRQEIRRQAVDAAMELLYEKLSKDKAHSKGKKGHRLDAAAGKDGAPAAEPDLTREAPDEVPSADEKWL